MPDSRVLDGQRFYTTDEVARLLRVTVTTIQRKIRRGDIPARKFGRQYLIPVEYVAKVIDWGKSHESA